MFVWRVRPSSPSNKLVPLWISNVPFSNGSNHSVSRTISHRLSLQNGNILYRILENKKRTKIQQNRTLFQHVDGSHGKLFIQQFSVELSSLRPIQHSLQICIQVGGSAHTTNVIQRIHNNLILSKGFRISSIVLVIWITIETNWLDFINYYCSSVFSLHFIETTKCWPFSIFNWYNMCVGIIDCPPSNSSESVEYWIHLNVYSRFSVCHNVVLYSNSRWYCPFIDGIVCRASIQFIYTQLT